MTPKRRTNFLTESRRGTGSPEVKVEKEEEERRHFGRATMCVKSLLLSQTPRSPKRVVGTTCRRPSSKGRRTESKSRLRQLHLLLFF